MDLFELKSHKVRITDSDDDSKEWFNKQIE